MANNTDSNITLKVAKGFKKGFEADVVLLNSVDTQSLENAGLGTPDYGESIKFKRPMQYRSKKTADGDISGGPRQDIIMGNSIGTVQSVYTVDVEWGILEEALRLNELDAALEPIAGQLVTDIETDLGTFMIKNSGLTYGTPGTPVTAWDHVAGAGALMQSIGVMGEKHYVMNPFSQTNLAKLTNGLASGAESLVNNAWQEAQISTKFGGLRAMSSNALSSYTSGTTVDRSATLAATPVATYASVKDSYLQNWSLTGIDATGTITPGEVLEVTGRYYINMKTRKVVMGANGLPIPYRATVVVGGTAVAGAVTVTVAPAAIFEANGQYNNISSAVTSGDVVTILGSASTEYQPNLFYSKAAFGVGFVKLPKLYSTDTVMTMKNGVSIRVSRYANGDKNRNIVRFDALPAFVCFNPLMAGRGWGTS